MVSLFTSEKNEDFLNYVNNPKERDRIFDLNESKNLKPFEKHL